MAVQKDSFLLECASDGVKKDKEVVLLAMANDFISYNCSLLEGYKTIDEVVNKKGKEFLFSCWKNCRNNLRLQVAKHPNFTHYFGTNRNSFGRYDEMVKEVYQLRKDEWLAR